MKAQESQFLTFLNGKKQFIIPIYQRTYSWTREQCQQLWTDIVRSATDKEATTHFIGSVVYIQHGIIFAGGVMPLLVIDGQQRMATLALLLIALAKAVKDAPASRNMSHEDIYESYLVNKFCGDEQYYKLLLTQSDKDTLIALTNDPDHAKSTLPPHRLLENYLYFENLIRQGDVDPYTLYVGISKLTIVEISLHTNHDNPQLIFESLNSTGMDLAQADLIRNYILMGLESGEQSRLYKMYWYPMEQSFRRSEYIDHTNQFDRFMRDYLTIKQGSIPNIDRVYHSFKTYHRNIKETPIAQIMADIDRYARYFVNMAFLQEKDDDIRHVLADIHALKVQVAYPFLLEVYEDYAQKLLSREDFIAILKLVESYVFRRVICGIPTNSLNKTFAMLAREIDKEQYLTSVQAAFLQKDSHRRFPKDEEFRAEFMVKDIYNLSIRNYVLRKLEHHGSKERVNVEDYTIEHIMPQHLSSEWQGELGPNWKEVHGRYLHTIGNLTLTGYNSELSNHPFREKRNMKGGFAKSPIRLNSSLAEVERWDEEEIKKRAREFANIAVVVWSIPLMSSEQVSVIVQRAQKGPLSEVIGPIDHPHAGFVPAGFKILQIKENRFHYFRQINDAWIQYSNGKDALYAISWDTAGKSIRDFSKKNMMPLRIIGTVASQYAKLATNIGNNGYSLEDHLKYMPLHIRGIFERLRKRILNLDSSVKEEVRRRYIAYGTTTDFVDIELQKKQLRVILNVRLSEINDPKGLCKAVIHTDHPGNGGVEVSMHSFDQFEDVMDIIHQAFEKHSEGVYV
ncbi:MAG TPA: DUF262 and DUF1524 domain-containing protein [Ktedonobacteraceae bacterium]|nr:DUF262 and DUF1524 domain-containing protein [Ktedonobacteraceae bacterium]